jgi:hypothetical protein
VFNATFSNISAISWRQVLEVEEAGVPGENHRPWASNWASVTRLDANKMKPTKVKLRWAHAPFFVMNEKNLRYMI